MCVIAQVDTIVNEPWHLACMRITPDYDEAAEFEGDVVHDREHALNTYALDTHTHTHSLSVSLSLSARHLRSFLEFPYVSPEPVLVK